MNLFVSNSRWTLWGEGRRSDKKVQTTSGFAGGTERDCGRDYRTEVHRLCGSVKRKVQRIFVVTHWGNGDLFPLCWVTRATGAVRFELPPCRGDNHLDLAQVHKDPGPSN
jgi:hypothetical protein